MASFFFEFTSWNEAITPSFETTDRYDERLVQHASNIHCDWCNVRVMYWDYCYSKPDSDFDLCKMCFHGDGPVPRDKLLRMTPVLRGTRKEDPGKMAAANKWFRLAKQLNPTCWSGQLSPVVEEEVVDEEESWSEC